VLFSSLWLDTKCCCLSCVNVSWIKISALAHLKCFLYNAIRKNIPDSKQFCLIPNCSGANSLHETIQHALRVFQVWWVGYYCFFKLITFLKIFEKFPLLAFLWDLPQKCRITRILQLHGFIVYKPLVFDKRVQPTPLRQVMCREENNGKFSAFQSTMLPSSRHQAIRICTLCVVLCLVYHLFYGSFFKTYICEWNDVKILIDIAWAWKPAATQKKVTASVTECVKPLWPEEGI